VDMLVCSFRRTGQNAGTKNNIFIIYLVKFTLRSAICCSKETFEKEVSGIQTIVHGYIGRTLTSFLKSLPRSAISLQCKYSYNRS
jgi:hypothetical protein